MHIPILEAKAEQLKLGSRLTTLWGFNEAAFGGVLHLLRFPLRGMFIGANAVLLLSLISYFSRKKEELLKATMMVILVKAIISPYTPLNAYFAVAFQGGTGYLFYKLLPWRKVALLFNSVLAQIQSSVQRFITLTIFFGMTFWESLNIYINYVLEKVGIESLPQDEINYSMIIILGYVSLHVAMGIYISVIGWGSPEKIMERLAKKTDEANTEYHLNNSDEEKKGKRKKRFWWQRKSGIILLVLFAIMMALPFIDPTLEKGNTFNVIYMLSRAIVITFLWFFIVSPFIVKYLRKFLKKKETAYANELNDILEIIPRMKQETKKLWKKREVKGIGGLKSFTLDLFYTLLLIK